MKLSNNNLINSFVILFCYINSFSLQLEQQKIEQKRVICIPFLKRSTLLR